MTRFEGNLILWLLWRWAARLQHLLHKIKSHACLCLVLSNSEEVEEIVMSHVRAAGVTMLVHEPLELCCVGVACTDVLRLQMLQLTVDVITFPHTSLFSIVRHAQKHDKEYSSIF